MMNKKNTPPAATRNLDALLQRPDLRITVVVSLDDLRLLLRETLEEQRKIPAQEEYLSRKETARLLSVTVATLYNWRRAGNLKPVRIGHKLFYRRSDLQRLFNER